MSESGSGMRGWAGARGTPIAAVGEFGLIDRLRRVIEACEGEREIRGPRVTVGIGDDAAAIAPTPGFETLITCDIQVAGRHFVPEWTDPRTLGTRIAAVNLSDIGAMGGIPRAAVVSLGIGPEIALEDMEALYDGLCTRLLDFDARLIGGNITGLTSGLLVDLTLLGEVEQGRAVRRHTAEPGDIVWVTGAPGSAGLGLALLLSLGPEGLDAEQRAVAERYLCPPSRAREGRALGASGSVSAMIDLSDGLVGDLTHLCEGREIGIVIREESLPIGEEFARAATLLARAPAKLLLGPSDDYELIFTTHPDRGEEAVRALRAISDVAVWPIGEVAGGLSGAVLLEDRKGVRWPGAGRGWDHFHSR